MCDVWACASMCMCVCLVVVLSITFAHLEHQSSWCALTWYGCWHTGLSFMVTRFPFGFAIFWNNHFKIRSFDRLTGFTGSWISLSSADLFSMEGMLAALSWAFFVWNESNFWRRSITASITFKIESSCCVRVGCCCCWRSCCCDFFCGVDSITSLFSSASKLRFPLRRLFSVLETKK